MTAGVCLVVCKITQKVRNRFESYCIFSMIKVRNVDNGQKFRNSEMLIMGRGRPD